MKWVVQSVGSAFLALLIVCAFTTSGTLVYRHLIA